MTVKTRVAAIAESRIREIPAGIGGIIGSK